MTESSIDDGSADLRRWAPSIEAYAEWIDRADFTRAAEWCHRLRSADGAEGAVAEAVAWDWLIHRVDKLEATATTNDKTADFECHQAGTSFYVEVTNISRHTMTTDTHLEDSATNPYRAEPRRYTPPFDRLRQSILRKVKKGESSRCPYLVLVTTLHGQGSRCMQDSRVVEAVLHSQTSICGRIDSRGDAIGQPVIATDLKRSAFTATQAVTSVRHCVSGALFGPFGLYPKGVDVFGLLHPEPLHAFSPTLLPDVRFCRFAQWPPSSGRVDVEWVQDEQVIAPARGRVETRRIVSITSPEAWPWLREPSA